MGIESERTDANGRWNWLAALFIVATTVVVFWPGLSGDWGRDDFMQLAMVRLIDNPWVLFTTDHFPLAGTVFRPMGFASFWLGHALAGTEFHGHALHTMALYAGLALVLFAMLRAFSVGLIAAVLATLLFALHPVAIGTGLWWSARFDLLATLFVLLAVLFARRATRTASTLSVSLTLLSLLAAMLSKEIGLIGVPAVMALWLHWAWTERHRARLALGACLLCALTAIVFLLWRAAVLDTAGSMMTGEATLLEALLEGIGTWLTIVAGYIGFASRLGPPGWVAAGAFVLTAVLVAATFRQDRTALPLLLSGALLLVLPGLLQAPVARLNAEPLSAGMSAVEAAMQSRLYFMSLAGLAMIAAWLLNACLPAPRRIASGLMVLGLGLLVGVFAQASHRHAESIARISRDNAELAHRALAAMADFEPPSAPCHLVFEGVESPPEWGIYVSMDSIVKALHAELETIDHCFVHADDPTFFHLLGSEHAGAASAPLAPFRIEGRPVPRHHVDGLTVVYLEGPGTLDPEVRDRLPRIRLPSPEG